MKKYAIIDNQGDYFCLNFGAGKIAFRNKEFAYLYADRETAEYIARQLTKDGYKVQVVDY